MGKQAARDWRRFCSRRNIMIAVSAVLLTASGLYRIFAVPATDSSAPAAQGHITNLAALSAMTAMLRRIHGISVTLRYTDARERSHTLLVHINDDKGEK